MLRSLHRVVLVLVWNWVRVSNRFNALGLMVMVLWVMFLGFRLSVYGLWFSVYS